MSTHKNTREQQMELALLMALWKIEESDDPADRKWARLTREHFGFPAEKPA